MTVIVISKMIGMFRDVVLANYYGTSNISDAYLIASSVPTLLFYFVGNSLSTAYIPMYNKVKKEKGIIAANRYSSNLTNIAFLLCTVIILLLLIFPSQIVSLFAAGFDNETTILASSFIRTSAFSLYLMVMVNIGGGFLQINDNFLVPAAISFPRNLAIIAAIILSSIFGVGLMGWGILAAYLFEVLFMLPFLKKSGYKYKPIIDYKDPNIKETLYIIAPVIIGVSINKINNIINQSIASTISEGAISALNYASVINSAVQEILVTGVITILFADSAAHVANNEVEKLKIKLAQTLNAITAFLIPAAVGVIILARPIVTVFFSRGDFNETSIAMTVSALQMFSVGLMFISARDALIKIFYAFKDTRTTTITAAIAICLNIILNLILAKRFGIMGLASATSISATLHCLILYAKLRKKIGDFYLKTTINILIKSIISSIIMGLAISLLYLWLISYNVMSVIALSLAVFAGVIIYMLLSILFRNKLIIGLLLKVIRRNAQ